MSDLGAGGVPACRSGPSSSDRPPPEVVGRDIDEPLLAACPDAPLVRLRERRPAQQRAPRVPRRLGAGLVVTESLYREHPDLAEGQLAKLRAAVVNMRALADVARDVRPRAVRHARQGRGGHRRPRQGLDPGRHRSRRSSAPCTSRRGIDAAARFVHHYFDPLIEEAATLGAGLDWKTSLQEMAAGSALGSPEYRVGEQGPDHEKEFHARVVVGEEVLGEGRGRSKKEAEQKAAKEAWHTLDDAGARPDPAADTAGPARPEPRA